MAKRNTRHDGNDCMTSFMHGGSFQFSLSVVFGHLLSSPGVLNQDNKPCYSGPGRILLKRVGKLHLTEFSVSY